MKHVKSHTTILILLVLISSVVIIAGMSQTNDELKRKYGSPDTEGRYIIRPGIGLSAKFDRNKVPTDMIVKPINSEKNELTQTDSVHEVIPSKVAEEVINELVPVEQRGKKEKTTTAEFGCTSVDYITFEKVKFNIANRCPEQGGGTYSIEIHLISKH